MAKISDEVKNDKEHFNLGKGLVFYDGTGTHERLTGYQYYTDAEGLRLSFGSWDIRLLQESKETSQIKQNKSA